MSKFYYFGFGSNLLARRIHIQNPTAVRIGPGKLMDHRLDFYSTSKTWNGAPATIVPTSGDCVYGAIWEIDCCNLQDLDNQEGVAEGIYVPMTVSVQAMENDKCIPCRVYYLKNQPKQDLRGVNPNEIPYDRQPSKTYLKTIVKGAIETSLPKEYVNWLRSIKHNGKMVDTFEKLLEVQQIQLNS